MAQLVNWLIDGSMARLVNWLIDGSMARLVNWLIDGSMARLVNWLIDGSMARLVNWLIDGSMARLVNWLIEGSMARLVNWLIDVTSIAVLKPQILQYECLLRNLGLEQGFYTLGNAESSLIPTSQVIPASRLEALQVVNWMLQFNMQVTSRVKINPQNNNKLNQEFGGNLSYTHAQTHIFMIKSFTQHHNTTSSFTIIHLLSLFF